MKDKQNKKIQKAIKNNTISVQKFLDIKAVGDNCLYTTRNEEFYYIKFKPINIRVLSDNMKFSVIKRITEILSMIDNVELLCMNGSQNFKNNLAYLDNLKNTEKSSSIASLDQQDYDFIENIKSNMATSRNFYVVIRLNSSLSDEIKMQTINNTMQLFNERNFVVSLADKQEIKQILSIYLEQNYNDDIADYDGQQYNLDKNNNLKNLVDVVCPSIIDFKHKEYYIIGNTYRCTYAIRNYPTITKKIALLSELGAMGNVTLHIYSHTLPAYEQEKIFNNSARNNSGSLDSRDITERTIGKNNIIDIENVLDNAHKDNTTFLSATVYIEMIATSEIELQKINTKVGQILSSNSIVADKLLLQQRDGFCSVSPFGTEMFGKEFSRVLPAPSVANIFPFAYSGRTDNKGMYIGTCVNGSNLLVDFDKRDRDITNGHIAIFGNSGEGKSYLIKLLICIFRQQKKKLYSLDSEPEFEELTKNLGGTSINMMSGKYIINILEPRKLHNDNVFEPDEPSSFKFTTKISQHIAFLRDFFKTYKPELTSSELDVLEIMLENLYLQFNITDNSDFDKLSSTDYPVLKNLFDVINDWITHYDERAKDNTVLFPLDMLKSLALALRSICIGTDSKFFNGYTNVPNAEHINFNVKELLSTNENLKNAMYFNILTFMNYKFLSEGECVVIVDELHEFVKSKIVVNYLRSFIKRGRKKNSNLVIASQNLEDIMLPDIVEYTKPFFSIPSHRFLFYPGTVDIETYKHTTNLTDAEYELISIPYKGRCVYCVGNERYQLEVKAPPHKKILFGEAGGT